MGRETQHVKLEEVFKSKRGLPTSGSLFWPPLDFNRLEHKRLTLISKMGSLFIKLKIDTIYFEKF